MSSSLPAESPLSPPELKLVVEAAQYLENPSLLMQLAGLVGKPLQLLLHGIDRIAPERVHQVVNSALGSALSVAVYTLPGRAIIAAPPEGDINDIGTSTSFWHKVSVAATGTTSGLFGIGGLAVELPITTTIMFRSIAAIAQEFGEDLNDPNIRLQCLSVFYLGGPNEKIDALDSTYLAARVGLQESFAHAARVIATASADELATMIQKGTAPAIVNFIGRIAAQFEITVSQKVFAQAIPMLGAATGATINVAFMGHFNRVARYHFGIRSLERKYGQELAQAIYQREVTRLKQK
jgi:hypothetical protein